MCNWYLTFFLRSRSMNYSVYSHKFYAASVERSVFHYYCVCVFWCCFFSLRFHFHFQMCFFSLLFFVHFGCNAHVPHVPSSTQQCAARMQRQRNMSGREREGRKEKKERFRERVVFSMQIVALILVPCTQFDRLKGSESSSSIPIKRSTYSGGGKVSSKAPPGKKRDTHEINERTRAQRSP